MFRARILYLMLLASLYAIATVDPTTIGLVDAFVLDTRSVSSRFTLGMVKSTASVVVAPVFVPTTADKKNENDNAYAPLPQLTKDLTDLADVRYDEFVAHHDEIDLLELQKPPPSQRAFHMATAEVAQERLGQATSFWAKIDDASVGQ